MNNTVNKAIEINEFVRSIPNLEVGDIVTLFDVWDGEGEVPESSYSYYLTHDGGDEFGNVPVSINYVFEILESMNEVGQSVIKIISIDFI